MGGPISLDRARAMRKIVYGARCTWWDSIDKIGIMPGTDKGDGFGGLPCCPHCQGVYIFCKHGVGRIKDRHARSESNVCSVPARVS